MTLKEIYKKMNILEDKLYNSQAYNKEDLLNELNEIGKELFKLPPYIRYRELSILYMQIFDEPLFAKIEY